MNAPEDIRDKVARALLGMQRHAWEQGVAAQAFLESGESDLVVVMAREAVTRQFSDGRLGMIGLFTCSTDPAANGEAVLFAARVTGDASLRDAAERQADWLLHKAPRTADGTLCHHTDTHRVWVDSLYMAPPFLAVAGYPEEALRQVEGFRRLLWNPAKRLFHHIWDEDLKGFARAAFWGVGNGWAAAGMARVIAALPPATGQRDRLIAYLQEVIDGCLVLQREDALFHDILDDTQSFVETNLAQMLSYAIYRSVAAGWLKATYLDRADAMRAPYISRWTITGLCRACAVRRTSTGRAWPPRARRSSCSWRLLPGPQDAIEAGGRGRGQRAPLPPHGGTPAMLPHTEDDRMDSTQASGKAHSEGTGYALRAISGYHASRPGIQIATQMSAAASEEDMRFAQQLGIEWVMTSLDKPEEHTAESYLRLRRKFEAFGLRIYRLANHACHNMEEVTLNLPGRDEKVAQYLDYIRNLGKAGIHYSTYAHMGNGIWSTGRATMRGGVEARAFDLAKAKAGYWNGRVFEGPLTHGRVYTEEELWENYAYFIKKVVPVAEEAGVFIGVHPDDPPVYPLGGIPRCIFGTFAGYKRALEIANSPNIGVCLCIGCWLEGGQGMGADVIEAIRYFGARGKLFKAHFRNVSRPMPAPWAETFMDDGYMNMHQVVKALREVRFDGAIISDHLPSMIGGRRAAEAYSVAYMRALVQAADDECTGA